MHLTVLSTASGVHLSGAPAGYRASLVACPTVHPQQVTNGVYPVLSAAWFNTQQLC